MTNLRQAPFTYRFARCLLPSPISALLCCCFGVLTVGAYLILKSVSIGTALPALFDGEWGIAYTNHIVQPLLSVFSNLTIGKLAIIFTWGLVGLAVYFALFYAAAAYRGWREAARGIQITDRAIIRHPSIYPLIAVALWRLAVIIILPTIFLVISSPIIRGLSDMAPHVIEGNLATSDGIIKILVSVAGIGLLSHLFVVFLRLLMMRVRLFNDNPL